jgi:hypothetical protein
MVLVLAKFAADHCELEGFVAAGIQQLSIHFIVQFVGTYAQFKSFFTEFIND